MRAISLATYNIHKCVGLDGRWDPRRIFNVIDELGADLLAIQEFDNRHRAGRGDIAPETFAEVTGMHLLVQPTMTEGKRFHGNLLLSRWPVVSWKQMELAVPGAEPRGAIFAEIDVHGSALTVVATHLGLGPLARREQLRRLLEAPTLSPDRPAVLLGDVNEWLPFGGVATVLDRSFGPQRRLRTNPALLPMLALDTIRARPASALQSLRAHRSRAAVMASDHLPLSASFHLNGA